LPMALEVVKCQWEVTSAAKTQAVVKLWKELALFCDVSHSAMKEMLRVVVRRFSEAAQGAFLPTITGQEEAQEGFTMSGAVGECAPFINQAFRKAGELINGVKAFKGVVNPEVWICHAMDGKWRVQHEPDRGTAKAYAFTTACDPPNSKDWGVWSNGMWGEQVLTVRALTERVEVTHLCDRLFYRACKLLHNVCLFDGIIAATPLQRIVFSHLIDPLLLSHIRSQKVSIAIQKALFMLQCMPTSWFVPPYPVDSNGIIECATKLRKQAGFADTACIVEIYRRLNMRF